MENPIKIDDLGVPLFFCEVFASFMVVGVASILVWDFRFSKSTIFGDLIRKVQGGPLLDRYKTGLEL